ncbi:MAG: hypothetical protein Q8O03_07950 [Nanoarchaeota archaeon]|nr:hypothetical protein [Nanoarchaeota archaeon]
MKKALVGLGLAGLLFFTPAIPTYAQHSPAEQTTLEYKIEKTFPNKPIQDIEDFRQYSDDIIKIVAEKMHIKLDEKIPKPKIITEKEMTLDEYNRRAYEFSKKAGYPLTKPLEAMCSTYFVEENEILISEDRKLHTLAHELVHYLQIKYRQDDPLNDPYDNLEREAIYIQLEFKDKYLK